MGSQYSLDSRTPEHADVDEALVEEPQSFTVGKIDAGVAVLLGPAFHLVEFPSVLLPASCRAGSIVSISCHRALDLERDADLSFQSLQESILKTYGSQSPSPPELSILGTTQTSVTLTWAPLQLANAKLLSLSVYRNNERLSLVPNPFQNTATKVSSLTLSTEYEFHLILKTTAGVFHSNHVKAKTHTINDTSGVNVCFGHIYPIELRDEAEAALRRMDAKWSTNDTINIETTHFVCTSAGSGNSSQQIQKAERINLPIVTPSWILACDKEKRMMNVSKFLLSSERLPPNNAQPREQAQASQPASSPPQPVPENLPKSNEEQVEANTATDSTTPTEDDTKHTSPVPAPAPESDTSQNELSDSIDVKEEVSQPTPTPEKHETSLETTANEEQDDESSSSKEPSEVDNAEGDIELQNEDVGSLEDVKI